MAMHPAVQAFKALPPPAERGWEEATAKAKLIAQNRAIVVKPLAIAESLNKAFDALKNALDNGVANPQVARAIKNLGKMPSKATVYNWVNQYKEQGLPGLLPQHKGKAATVPDWADKCLMYYHSINKPSFAFVASALKREGFNATDAQVRRFIHSLPGELGPRSRWRMGAKLHREQQRDFLIRDTTHFNPGDVYNADGHTIDVYLAHHNTGKAFRYELTAFQDVASRIIVGWELSHSESAISTMAGLTRAIKDHDHVPAMLYIDNGSGYKSRMMNDDTAGVYSMFEIEPIFAIPGNARAKWIERFFRHMEGIVGKQFNTYCGPGHNGRELLKTLNQAKKDNSILPTVDDWIAAFKQFLDEYHNAEHPEIKGKTRLQVWQERLKRVKPHIVDYTILPQQQVNVRRSRVTLHKRVYAADNLYQYNDRTLLAAYDLHDDSYIKLYTLSGEFVMFAQLKQKTHAIPTSRLDEAKARRLEGQRKRLQNKIDEVAAQAALDVIDGEATEVNDEPTLIDINDAPAIAEQQEYDLSAIFEAAPTAVETTEYDFLAD